jgi:NAD(P)-dependent dehydrogenase (short-subunit alcohol dehydrogenase family)
MKLQDAIVLITGANRGIGFAFAEAALARGARKVYAGVRSPSSINTPGLVPVKLDVTSDRDVAEAARICSDVTLVVNNAGLHTRAVFLTLKRLKLRAVNSKPTSSG